MPVRSSFLLSLMVLGAVACTAPALDPISGDSESRSSVKDKDTDANEDTAVSSPQWTNRKIPGATVLEGDIVIPGAGQSIAAAINSGVAKWPNGVIPYEIEPGMAAPERVTQAAQHWASKTGIRFVPRTNEVDYVHIYAGEGCWSMIGRMGGKQDMSLQWDTDKNWGCGVAEAIHEMGHAVGLAHEQSRADRDDYVVIHWDNIEDANKYNFDKINFQSMGKYDLTSIMQYRADAFSKNGQLTITAKDGSVPTTNVQGLSDSDAAGVREYYAKELKGDNTDIGGVKAVALSWPMRSNTATYSLDVQDTNGNWYAPCVNAGVIGRSLNMTFNGVCPSAANAYVQLTNIQAFRMCSAENQDWQHAICDTKAYHGEASFEIRP